MEKSKVKNKSKARGKKAKRHQPQQLQNTKYILPIVAIGWKVFLFCSAILSFVIAIYFFLPKLSVFPHLSLNPTEPFATPFILKNESVFSIYDVVFSCGIRKVESKESNSLARDFRTMFANAPIPFITSGEQTKTLCVFPFRFRTPITFADIEIIVQYKPKFIPIPREASFRFSTSTDKNGELIWIPKAVSEMNERGHR